MAMPIGPLTDRQDDELGLVRRCARCREELPLDASFFTKYRKRSGVQAFRRQCIACTLDIANGRPIPLKPMTHGQKVDWERKRARERQRKAELRADPILGEKLRKRQREAQARYYARNRMAKIEYMRARYAALLDRPVREGIGRPRVAA